MAIVSFRSATKHSWLRWRCVVAEKYHSRWRHTHADLATPIHTENDLDTRLKGVLVCFEEMTRFEENTKLEVYACVTAFEMF